MTREGILIECMEGEAMERGWDAKAALTCQLCGNKVSVTADANSLHPTGIVRHINVKRSDCYFKGIISEWMDHNCPVDGPPEGGVQLIDVDLIRRTDTAPSNIQLPRMGSCTMKGKVMTGPNKQAENVRPPALQNYWVPRCPVCLKFPDGKDLDKLTHVCEESSVAFQGDLSDWKRRVALKVRCTSCGKTPEFLPENVGQEEVDTDGFTSSMDILRHVCRNGVTQTCNERKWVRTNWPGLVSVPFEYQEELWHETLEELAPCLVEDADDE